MGNDDTVIPDLIGNISLCINYGCFIEVGDYSIRVIYA